MDGRDGMALSGSAPYYLHRGLGTSGGPSTPPDVFSSAVAFRNLSNTNPDVHHHQVQSNTNHDVHHHQVQSNFKAGSNSVGSSTFNVEGSPRNFSPHGFTVTVPPSSSGGDSFGGGASFGGGEGRCSEQLVKKKRGRPRKYGLNGPGASSTASGAGAVSLGLSPLSSPNSNTPSEKKKRGRPLGSGWKQRLASVGEWMSSSAGVAFTPHVICVAAGEDIAARILDFAQQRPRALCIMSGCGGVSAVTLRSSTSAVGTITYEGRFEILCLSGSYLVMESEETQNRTGGVNVSLARHDGLVIGGSVGGRLIASRAVQIVVCTFVYGDPKLAVKDKTELDTSNEGDKNNDGIHTGDENRAELGPCNPPTTPSQNLSPGSNIGWPGSKSMDGKNPNTDIDLMRG